MRVSTRPTTPGLRRRRQDSQVRMLASANTPLLALVALVSGTASAAFAPSVPAPTQAPAPRIAPTVDPEVKFSDHTPKPGATLEYGEPSQPDESEFRYVDRAKNPHADLERAPEARSSPPLAAIERERDRGPVRKHDEVAQASMHRFTVGVELGPYLPRVDAAYNEKNGDDALGAYAQVFGEMDDDSEGRAIEAPRQGVITRVGFDWNFLDLQGPLSVGVAVGFFRDKALALVEESQLPARRRAAALKLAHDPHADVSALLSVRSLADETAFHVVPIELSLGYRFDLLDRRTPVPLMPYVRGGYTYGVWWSTVAGRIERNDADEKVGRGGSSGLHLELGLMANLDFISGSMAGARTRTMIYGEYRLSKIGGFGAQPKRNIGDRHWLGGVAIEF